MTDSRSEQRNIVVAIPMGPGSTRIEVVQFVFALINWAQRQETPTRIHLVANASTMGVDFARNDLLRRVREQVPEYTEILFIDNDTAPSIACLRVLDVKADIVAGLTHFVTGLYEASSTDITPTAIQFNPMVLTCNSYGVPIVGSPEDGTEIDDGVYEVDAVGFSFCRIARWVLEDQRMELPEIVEGYDGTPIQPDESVLTKDAREALQRVPRVFRTPRSACGYRITTEDVHFCLRAKRILGARVAVDMKARVNHLKPVWVDRIGDLVQAALDGSGISQAVLDEIKQFRQQQQDDAFKQVDPLKQ